MKILYKLSLFGFRKCIAVSADQIQKIKTESTTPQVAVKNFRKKRKADPELNEITARKMQRLENNDSSLEPSQPNDSTLTSNQQNELSSMESNAVLSTSDGAHLSTPNNTLDLVMEEGATAENDFEVNHNLMQYDDHHFFLSFYPILSEMTPIQKISFRAHLLRSTLDFIMSAQAEM